MIICTKEQTQRWCRTYYEKHRQERIDSATKWKSDNRQKHLDNCRRYYRKHKEEMLRKNKMRYDVNRELYNRLKMKPCKDCGIQYNPWVMDFDHRDPSQKDFAVSEKGWYSEDVIKEVSKCDVVCSNCHRERTHRQKLSGVVA